MMNIIYKIADVVGYILTMVLTAWLLVRPVVNGQIAEYGIAMYVKWVIFVLAFEALFLWLNRD